MLNYFIAGGIGFFVGVVVSCILLAKKNLETVQKIENNVERNLKQNFKTAKDLYKFSVEAYENGEDINSSTQDNEEEKDADCLSISNDESSEKFDTIE